MKNKYINILNKIAIKTADHGEIPIVCLIVKDNEIIAMGINDRETTNLIHAHAEINALNQASQLLGTWKLNECEMYISTEPCLMCYGAIKQARIKKVYVASIQDTNKKLSYKNYISDDPLIDYSYLNEETSMIIKNYFKQRR